MSNILDRVEKVTPVPKTGDETVLVSIPVEDLYEYAHPGVQLNSHKFEPGNTYSVPAEVGAEIEDRLARFNKEQVRLLRPRVDRNSINQVNKGSNWTRGGGGTVGDYEAQLKGLGERERVISVRW